MSSFRKIIASIGDDSNSAKHSLYRCRDQKYRLETAVDDLSNDIYRLEKQLNKTYRRHVLENKMAEKQMKVIKDYKIYPKGVRPGSFPLYTPEGERFLLEKPAEGNVYERYLVSNNNSSKPLSCYSVVKTTKML